MRTASQLLLATLAALLALSPSILVGDSQEKPQEDESRLEQHSAASDTVTSTHDDDPTSDEAETDAGGPADDAIEVGDDTEPVVGRIAITVDAPAQVLVDGASLGLLDVESTLVHEARRREGTVRATSVENAAAKVEKSYAFDEVGEDPKDGAAAEPAELLLHFKVAKALRDVRKKERRSGVYPDFKGGLMWRRADNSANLTWKAAGLYCDRLSFGGWDDWRLPRLDELEGLQAMWSRAAFKTIDPISLSSCCPWSSSEIDEDTAWNYNFRFRKAFEGRKALSFGLRALCVRDLTDEEMAEHQEALEKRKKKRRSKKKADDEAALGTVDDVSGPPRDDGIN